MNSKQLIWPEVGNAGEALHVEQDVGLCLDAVRHGDAGVDAGVNGVPGVEKVLAFVDVAVHRVEHATRAADMIARAHEIRAADRPRVVGGDPAIDERLGLG
jgi:hypothetical protein